MVRISVNNPITLGQGSEDFFQSKIFGHFLIFIIFCIWTKIDYYLRSLIINFFDLGVTCHKFDCGSDSEGIRYSPNVDSLTCYDGSWKNSELEERTISCSAKPCKKMEDINNGILKCDSSPISSSGTEGEYITVNRKMQVPRYKGCLKKFDCQKL